MTHKLPLQGAGCVTSLRCVALSCTLIFVPPLFAGDVETEPAPVYTDYSVCGACDVSSADDPKVKEFAVLIAETRWKMRGAAEGVMVISNDQGESGRWHWTSSEGVLETLEREKPQKKD
jgi:hypothetical protein